MRLSRNRAEIVWADLVRVDSGALVNRGCVLQTHLFHDRLMRLDEVHVHSGATLGAHSIALPGSAVGAVTTVRSWAAEG